MSNRNGKYQPREYQQDSINDVRAAARKRERPILVLPTGGGKTKTAVHGIVAPAVAKGAQVLWIAHRAELIQQADDDLRDAGLRTGIIMGSAKADPEAPVQVASVATLARRLGNLPEARVVIVDECHHVRSATYMAVVRKYHEDGAIVVGLTATPQRLDGKGLGEVFDTIVERVTVRELIDAGYLTEYRYWAPYVPDLSGIRKVGGDYSRKGTADAMNKARVTGDLVTHYNKHLRGKRALVFACSIAHSQAVVAAFRAAGITAEHLDGTDNAAHRAEVLARFRNGDVQVVSNVDLFDEGFDCPAIEGVLIARPTQSFTKHRQMIGRALRVAPGKPHAIILDHAGNFLRHGMPDDVTEWDLEDKPDRKPDSPRHKQCPACFAVLPVHVQECPQCGHRFAGRPRTGPEFEDGDLEEVKQRKWTKQDKADLFRSLLAKARAMGYMRGWAKRQYRLKTKVWPKGLKHVEREAMRACQHAKVDSATGRCRFCEEYVGGDDGYAKGA